MIDIRTPRAPTFRTARGIHERWQHPVRMRDAMIRVERFRDEHNRRHLAEHGPGTPLDTEVSRRHYIDGLERQLEEQQAEAERTGAVLPGFVSVPDYLISDELMPELRRLHERFPNVTFIREEQRPWHLGIADDAEPELWDEVVEITVLVPDKSRGVRRPRGGTLDDWTGITVVNGYLKHGLGRHEGRLIHDTVYGELRPSPFPGEQAARSPHEHLDGLLYPWTYAHGWVERDEPRRRVEAAGREAESVALDRLIPFSDARMMGDDDNPHYVTDMEHIELVFDVEHGVVLEVREMFEGEIAVREFFSEIAFDVPVDPALFAIPRSPDRTG